MPTFNETPDGLALSVSGSASPSIVYNGNYTNLICLQDGFRGSINDVSVQTINGNLTYVFGSEHGVYGMAAGTYRFNIPQAYPIAFHNAGKVGITYTGQTLQGTKKGIDGNNYQFFYGIVTVTVTADFGLLSYESWNGGYLGGRRNIDFSYACRNSSLNRPKSADILLGETVVKIPQQITARYIVSVELPEEGDLYFFKCTGSADVSVQRRDFSSGGCGVGGQSSIIFNPIISTVRTQVGGTASVLGGRLSNPIIKGPNTGGVLSTGVPNSVVWQNATNALRENDLKSAFVKFDTTAGASNFLYVSGFDLDLPEFSVVTGIGVRIRRTASAGDIADSYVGLVYNDNGNIIKAPNNKALPGLWTGVTSSVTYGGAGDLWGRSWTFSEIMGSDFGVILSVLGDPALNSVAGIDYIEITAHYYQSIVLSGTGGGSLSGTASVRSISSPVASGGARAAGVGLNIYSNISGQGGVTCSGESAYDNFEKLIGGVSFISGSADVQLIINGNTEGITCLRAVPNNPNRQEINVATIQGTGVDAVYVFGDRYERYGLVPGVYRFSIPQAHPIAFLNFNRPRISYTGQFSQGTRVGIDGRTYTFFYGIVTLTITGTTSFAPISYQSFSGQSLGGSNNLIYSADAFWKNEIVYFGGSADNNSQFFPAIESSGGTLSGSADVSQTLNHLPESYGCVTSGNSEWYSSILAGSAGGLSMQGSAIDLVTFNASMEQGCFINGSSNLSATYYIESFAGSIVSGDAQIGIQPVIGETGSQSSGSSVLLFVMQPPLFGNASLGGYHKLQQTYNSIEVSGYAKTSGRARVENLKPLFSRRTGYAFAMASENILNKTVEDVNQIIRSKDSAQPMTIEETSYRLQHEPGWCDIGDSCGAAYLPKIIKNRQGKYLPSKNKRAVASRQITTLTEG